jgi:PAS domain S-box-containing protein
MDQSSDEKPIDEALCTSEERLQLALDTARMGQWDWNIVTGEVEWSDRCKALYGLPIDAPVTYEQFLQALHPEDRERVDTALRRAVEQRSSYDELKRTVWPDGSIHWTASRGQVYCDAQGQPVRMVGVSFDISKWKEAEEEHQSHLWILESLDQINRVIQGTNDLGKMMRNVLDVVLTIFDCDGAWLAYPCDPDAASWHVSMERTKPECPGAFPLGVEISMDQEFAKAFQTLVDADGPVKFGPGSEYPLPTAPPGSTAKHVHVKSMLAMAIYPKTAKAYLFGLHQAASPRVWTSKEERLFQEIGRRISDALTSLLSYQYLSESEERYRLIAENTADVISIHDLKLKPVYTSPSVEKLRGYTVEETLNQDLAEILTPDSLQKVKEVFAGQMELEKVKDADPNRSVLLELEEYHRDGHTIWVELAASFIRDKKMKAIGILTITRNIAKRKQAQLRLIESEQKFRSLAESIPDNIIRYNDKLQLTYVNQNMDNAVVFNFRPFIGSTTDKASRKMTPKGYRNTLKKVIRTGRAEELEIEVKNPEGELRIHNVRFVSERNNEGKIIGALAVGRDITEIKRTQDSLRKLSYAVEQSPVSIVITDTMGTIEYINPKFTEVTGYTSDEVIGLNPRILKSGNMPKDFYHNLWDTILNGGVWQGEFHNRKKNGELYYEAASISPIYNDEGTITHFVCVKEDITERKRLEQQFRQVQKMEAIGQLAGGVAHDFNNMLGVIIGCAELSLEKATKDASLRKNLEAILAAGHRSNEITRQLLAFARKQAITPRILDLNETVEGMLKLLRRLIGEDIDLVWLPGTKLEPVRMDPSQIDQILANLCVNARDALVGVGKVTIETQNATFDDAYCAEHEGSYPGEYVMLAVSDNGIGIDKATMDKIFEPFFTTKELGKGTGLGLATVYGIVKQNAGFINVYSEPDHGSTFKIYLPRHEAETDQIPKERPKAPTARGKENILLVEDEHEVLYMVKQMLERLGYAVMTASTPGEAIRVASEKHGEIHLLLTDVIMPEMNGRNLAEELSSRDPELKCLFMSGYTESAIAHHGVLDERANFLQKPFSNQELAVKVREVLDSG